jgi:Domain of unknown function (DUF4352)
VEWFKKHKVLTVILVLVVLLIIGSAGGGGTKKVGENGSNDTAKSANENKTYKVGDQVQSGDFVFTVNSVRNDQGSQFFKPKDGHVYKVANVTIENKSKDRTNISTLLQMYLKDAESTKFTPTVITSDTTGQVDGELLAGEKVKGDVAFEVPSTATGLKFYFTPEWLSGGTIVVDLGQ